MEITAKLVADLRKRTGLPMMKCKQALVAANGDIDAAIEKLREAGVKASDKVKDRELKDGLVFQHSDGTAASAVALRCETDFVARSAEFVAFGEALARDLLAGGPAASGNGDGIQDWKLADGMSVADHLTELRGKIRENIQVGDWAAFKPANGTVCSYMHHNSRIACLVEIAGDGVANNDGVAELGNDLGMQIAFHAEVQALVRDELDAEWVAKERKIYAAQSQDIPEQRREQVIEGRLTKRLKDVLLLEQPFIKNDKLSVRQRVEEVGKATGTGATVTRFARIAAGA